MRLERVGQVRDWARLLQARDSGVSLKWGLAAIDTKSQKQRKYPRHKAPRGMVVGWRSAGKRMVSRAETVGMGGLFLHTTSPLPLGSVIELLFDLKMGEVRARAVVRHSNPQKGMGVQFVEMQPADRARLNQFLSRYGSHDEVLPKPVDRAAPAGCSPKTPEAIQFERELTEHLEIARKGTYYQLLRVSTDSSVRQIKQSFYGLARKFHPDYHMGNKQWLGSLKELMAAATGAYKVLSDEDKRKTYDSQLASSGAYQLRRTRTAAVETSQECFARASACLRARNFVGSVVWLRKCVEITPDDAKYHALLARSLATIPQYRTEAIHEFERATELDPLNANLFFQFAELCREMEMPSRARPLYSKILEINPFHVRARERLEELGA